MHLDPGGRRLPGEPEPDGSPYMGFMMEGRGPNPCKKNPCGPNCTEGLSDEFDSYAHTANKDLKEYAESIIKIVQGTDGSSVPKDSMRELGRLQYDAHFFTMPEGVDLKAMWSNWVPIADIKRGTMAFLELEELAAKAVETADSLDALLKSRLSSRKHKPGCRCKTASCDFRYMYYAAKIGTQLENLMDKQLRGSGTFSREQMIEALRMRYHNSKITTKVFHSISHQQAVWDQQHWVHDITASSGGTNADNAALKEASDMLRAEMTHLRPLIRGAERLNAPYFRQPRFKCKYMDKEWNNAHGPKPVAAQ